MSRLILDEHIDYLEFMAKCNKENQRFVEAVNETVKFMRDMESKLAHYEDLEEQGVLIEIKEGQWIDNHCSICGMTPLGEEIWEHLDLDPPRFENYMNYCPNCGAKMEREDNE